jgi:cytochrome c-type biogenesis protein CcmH/NrfG
MRQFLTTLVFSCCVIGSCAIAAQPNAINSSDAGAAFRAGTALISPHLKLAEQEPVLDAARRSDLEKGIVLLEAVIRADSRNWQASWFIGKAQQALGNRSASNSAFKTAFLLEQNNPDVASE